MQILKNGPNDLKIGTGVVFMVFKKIVMPFLKICIFCNLWPFVPLTLDIFQSSGVQTAIKLRKMHIFKKGSTIFFKTIKTTTVPIFRSFGPFFNICIDFFSAFFQKSRFSSEIAYFLLFLPIYLS